MQAQHHTAPLNDKALLRARPQARIRRGKQRDDRPAQAPAPSVEHQLARHRGRPLPHRQQHQPHARHRRLPCRGTTPAPRPAVRQRCQRRPYSHQLHAGMHQRPHGSLAQRIPRNTPRPAHTRRIQLRRPFALTLPRGGTRVPGRRHACRSHKGVRRISRITPSAGCQTVTGTPHNHDNTQKMTSIIPILAGWTADKLLGDPERLPHPVVLFGKLISAGEHRLNKGRHRRLKGALLAAVLVALAYAATFILVSYSAMLSPVLSLAIGAVLVFYCLAGTTLIREVRGVFAALDVSLERGRSQVSRIVGRDTSQLSDNDVRKAALETLAENLSDGVIAPLFWLALLGVPGMVAYKMVNTLDSMIGYRTERYARFGTFAARLDDVANYIPARLTALLMVLVSGRPSLIAFVARNGRKHASPNSGYPESALAGILDCRFGGGHYYFNEYIDKPFIGENDRRLTTADMHTAVRINTLAELAMLLLVVMSRCLPALS